MALLDSDVSGTVVNICSGTDTALRTIIEKMNALAGYDIEVTVNPAFVRKNQCCPVRLLHSSLRK